MEHRQLRQEEERETTVLQLTIVFYRTSKRVFCRVTSRGLRTRVSSAEQGADVSVSG